MMETTTVTTQKATLYERLGGETGIRKIANDVLDKNYNNPLIGHHFRKVDMDRLKQLVFEFFSMGTGGPHQYTGRDMQTAHANLAINEQDFRIANQDTIEVMEAQGYDQEIITEVISILDSMRGDVIRE